MVDDLSDLEYHDATDQLASIDSLVRIGVIDRELPPTADYFHWKVLSPELLPEPLFVNYKNYGEIRWYTHG
jgi:hypothetical protein